MKDWLKKNWKLFLLAMVVVIVIIPFCINAVFKIHAPWYFLQAEWDASAALSFYGSIVAGVIAVYGVFLTIQYSQKSYKEDVRNRTLPFIAVEMLKTYSYKKLFPASTEQGTEESEGYYEYKLQDYYCILENGSITYKTKLSKNQQELLENGGLKWVANASGRSMVAADDVCVPFEIENVGNGPAIQFRYGLNRIETKAADRQYLPVIALKPKKPITFHIFSENCGIDSNNLGNYVLEFFYEDIYRNHYSQSFEIIIEYGKKENAPIVSINLEHKQNYLGGTING